MKIAVLIRLLIIPVFLCPATTLAQPSAGNSSDIDDVIQEFLVAKLPVTESIVVADVVALSTMVHRPHKSSPEGFFIENYTVDIIDTIITTLNGLPDRMNIFSFGGGLKKELYSSSSYLQNYYSYDDFVEGWSKISNNGKYLIFIESERRERNVLSGNPSYLAYAYRVYDSKNGAYIVLHSDHKQGGEISSEIGDVVRLPIDDIRLNVFRSNQLLDTHDYEADAL